MRPTSAVHRGDAWGCALGWFGFVTGYVYFFAAIISIPFDGPIGAGAAWGAGINLVATGGGIYGISQSC
jgi:hypothetical protein